MANDEVIGPRKTMFVLVIVVGCFAVLWPRILSPLVLGPTREQIQPNQFDREAGCCEVIFETDVAVLELVNEVCSSALGVGRLSPHSAAECRKAVNETCGVDIAVFLKRNENVGKTTKMLVETMQNSNSSCLREHFGVPVYSLGPHLASKTWDIKDTLKQERAPPMRGMGPHPALRERGRAIPPGPPGPPPPPARPVVLPPHVRVRSPLSVYYEVEQPPPIPGMRPPLGSPGGPVPAPKSSMGFVMPIYTICIIVFFVYTLSKILFRRTASPYDPVAPDPQFRRRVFRDDSRSSPDKLGKKEADTIVTAISGLVAEVQQQMEASYAQNQQRQDVQDNARPYTNGTILLNSGPVQIVASEYKESKEKTPEPVNEKEATPEPNEAEPTKVAKEPLEPDVVAPEPAVEPKESPDIREPSPEPALTLQQKETALETVVVTEPTPVLSFAQDHTEPILEPIETIPESEVVKELIPETIQQSINASHEVAEESITNDSVETSVVSDTKEPWLATEPTPEGDQATQESTTHGYSSDTIQISDPKNSLPDLEATVSEFTETISESKEPISEITAPILHSNVPEIDKPMPLAEESDAEPKECAPKPKEPSSVQEEPIPEPKESSPILKESSPVSEEPIPEPKESSPVSEEPIPEPKESSPILKESSPVPQERIPEPKKSPPILKESSPVPEKPNPEPKESSSILKESTSAPEEAIPELKEPSTVSKEPTSEPKKQTSEEELSSEREEISPETNKPILEPKEPTSEEALIDAEECELRDSKQSSPECGLDIPDSKETVLDTNKTTPDTKEPFPDSIELVPEKPTQNHPSSELIESSQELDALVVESSPEPSVDTSGLKEPTSQSREPTPEPKLKTEPKSIQTNQAEDSSVPEGSLIDLNEAIAEDKTQKEDDEDIVNLTEVTPRRDASEELLKVFAGIDKQDEPQTKSTEKFLEEQRFVLVQSTPDVTEENDKAGFPKVSDSEEEEIENAAVKVVGMELTAHPADGGAWPRELRPARPAPATPAPHEAEEVKSIFLETEIPQQSRVLVAQFAEDREESCDKPRPAKHAPLVVSGKMTLSLIQDAPRETPERDPESTLDDFTTASALTQPAAEKGEMESDEEVDEEIEVEEIEEEYEEDDEEEEAPAPVKVVKK